MDSMYTNARVTRWPAFGAVSACGSMVLSILCVRFFRAERGKTAHQQQSRTAVPERRRGAAEGKKADRVTRVNKGNAVAPFHAPARPMNGRAITTKATSVA